MEKKLAANHGKESVRRISVSLPESTYQLLNNLVEARGFESRSQAIGEMIMQDAAEHAVQVGDEIMTGTITLVYEHRRTGLRQQLANIEYENISEVITSLHVLLEDQHTMEVILVQGASSKLQEITNQLTTCKGVKTGKLSLSSTLIPPIQSNDTSKKR